MEGLPLHNNGADLLTPMKKRKKIPWRDSEVLVRGDWQKREPCVLLLGGEDVVG